MIGFYNNIYKTRPEKWSSESRDRFAFDTLSEFPEPSSFLDIGCGNGHTIRYFMKRWPETDYYGVDISDVAIGLAKKKVSTAQLFCGEIKDLELPRFNLITLMGVAEHFEDLSELIRVRELLAPSGMLYIEAPNCLMYSPSKEEGFRKSIGGQKEWHLKRESWEKMLELNGYNIVKSLTGEKAMWEFIWIVRKDES